MARWLGLSALSPVMRTSEGSRPDDNFQIDSDEETLRHFVRAKLYKAWSSYRKRSCSRPNRLECPSRGTSRCHYPERSQRLCTSCRFSRYLLGQDLLVAPITDPGVTVAKVYLPEAPGFTLSGKALRRAPSMGLHIRIAAQQVSPRCFVRRGLGDEQAVLAALGIRTVLNFRGSAWVLAIIGPTCGLVLG